MFVTNTLMRMRHTLLYIYYKYYNKQYSDPYIIITYNNGMYISACVIVRDYLKLLKGMLQNFKIILVLI